MPLIICFLIFALPLGAAETEQVAQVQDGHTVILEDGRSVRLVGIQVPKESRPILAEAAHNALADLVAGRTVTVSVTGASPDRHGRILAHLIRDDGLWIQEQMLRDGWARVYSFADNRARLAEMLTIERNARKNKRGIWADDFYAIRSAENPAPLDSFQLVEGIVLDAADVHERVYLNFGADWRTDFTATIAKSDRRVFDKAGIDPLALIGKRVRVRGWLYRYNGPALNLTHPEQIEVLTD
ncbi:MAG: thermonuclease family protein [Pseudomonadota bacterium]|nr:thermonuclease family protein [Pseudomonadota bacterium]